MSISWEKVGTVLRIQVAHVITDNVYSDKKDPAKNYDDRTIRNYTG